MRPREDFSGLSRSYCKPCDAAYERKWLRENSSRSALYKRRSIIKRSAADPEFYRKLTLRKYGLTPETFRALLASQNDRCGACGASEPGGRHDTWHVDHDHACCPRGKSCGGCIRGILCQDCNLLLGHARDDVERLAAAIAYLNANRRPALRLVDP